MQLSFRNEPVSTIAIPAVAYVPASIAVHHAVESSDVTVIIIPVAPPKDSRRIDGCSATLDRASIYRLLLIALARFVE